MTTYCPSCGAKIDYAIAKPDDCPKCAKPLMAIFQAAALASLEPVARKQVKKLREAVVEDEELDDYDDDEPDDENAGPEDEDDNDFEDDIRLEDTRRPTNGRRPRRRSYEARANARLAAAELGIDISQIRVAVDQDIGSTGPIRLRDAIPPTVVEQIEKAAKEPAPQPAKKATRTRKAKK